MIPVPPHPPLPLSQHTTTHICCAASKARGHALLKLVGGHYRLKVGLLKEVSTRSEVAKHIKIVMFLATHLASAKPCLGA